MRTRLRLPSGGVSVYRERMKIADLRLYPIKSCRGLSVETATIEARGFAGDRRAMIVHPDGRFLTQRSHPNLAQISVGLDEGLALTLGGRSVVAAFGAERLEVQVWGDTVSARVAEGAVNAALSDFLGEPVQLVLMDAQSDRPTDPRFGSPSQVSFADGFPYLITTTGSLDALRASAGDQIPMDRFRPNIVIETEAPWLEDTWTTLDLGGQVFDLVKPCTRCVMTTLDQETGDQVGQSTMQALIQTRARAGDWGRGVLFGMNAIARTPGAVLRCGMPVTVV